MSGQPVFLRFEQAPVSDVVHAVLGDILGLPYVINQPVSGALTIHTSVALPRDQVLPVLEAVLAANGLHMIADHAGVYHVGPPQTLAGVAPSLGNLGGALLAGQRLLIVPLQYVGAAEMADILRPLATPETFVRIDTARNLLILAGTRSRLEGLMEIITTFDVDLLKGMSFGLFPLQHVSAAEVDVALKALMGNAGALSGGAGAPPRTTAARADTAPQAAGPETLGHLAGVVRVIALERLNALLVVTSRSHYLDQAREWIEQLDQPRDDGNEPQLFVYAVQNGTASHLSSVLNALFGAGPLADEQRDAGIAPSLSAALVGTTARRTGQDTMTTTMATTAPERNAFGLSGARRGLRDTATTAPDRSPLGFSQSRLAADVNVVADEFNNALLILAPRAAYRKIEAALRRLDVAPMQVLIEASILEVSLTDEFQFGLQWFFKGGVGGGLTGSGLLNTNPTGPIGPTQPGFSYTVTDSIGQVRAVLNALAQKSLLNVISSPSVMVLDNHSAQIHVGDQQPVRSAVTITDGGVTTTSIQFKDTGVMLDVAPSVNAGGLVSMLINQRVTDVGTIDEATGQRSFLQREISSRVAVRSGETVVLGGLIRDNTTKGKTGIPVLHDIPILGHLFGQTSRNNNRTELIVLITPRVLQRDSDVRAASEEMRRRLAATLGVLPGWTTEGPLHLVPPSVQGIGPTR